MRAAVLIFPGSNRDGDVARALYQESGVDPVRIWHQETQLPKGLDLVVLPGGFSYGDYLRCGAIASRSPVMAAVRAHAARGGFVLGICNGFQILCESGLLPGVLMRNQDLHFICKFQHIRVERADTPFARKYEAGQVLKMAIAHGEGNYEVEEETLSTLEGEGRIAFRYCTGEGARGPGSNPNGSVHDIAGIYSETFNVLGMMPHPENVIDSLVGGTDGRGIFKSLVV